MSYNIIEELIGKTIIKIEKYFDDNILEFHLSNGAIYQQLHTQDCCESVHIEDINGNLDDLIGCPLLQAEESYSDATNNNDDDDNYVAESATWTFYKFSTIKGYVTIRWYGSSNGYYSETANMIKLKDEDPIKEQRRKKINCINNQ